MIGCNAGDVQDAIDAAVERKIVVSLSVKDNTVTKIEYAADATAQEKATAQLVVSGFDWNTKPLTQRDTDLATVKTYLSTAKVDDPLAAAIRLITG